MLFSFFSPYCPSLSLSLYILYYVDFNNNYIFKKGSWFITEKGDTSKVIFDLYDAQRELNDTLHKRTEVLIFLLKDVARGQAT